MEQDTSIWEMHETVFFPIYLLHISLKLGFRTVIKSLINQSLTPTISLPCKTLFVSFTLPTPGTQIRWA